MRMLLSLSLNFYSSLCLMKQVSSYVLSSIHRGGRGFQSPADFNNSRTRPTVLAVGASGVC